MSKFIKRQNKLKKAQARFEKVSRRSKQFKVNFERRKNSSGKFKTHVNIICDEKSYGGKGLIHKIVNQKSRFTGDKPSVTKFIDSQEPKTFKGKLFKKSAQTLNFAVHDTVKTAVDVALASETIGLKSADVAFREVKNNLKQKYTREAVDDYHKGTFFITRTAFDAVRGTRNHFKSKKQYKLEKAKFKLKKVEYSVFKNDTFKPKFQKNNADFKSEKLKFRGQKKAYKSGGKSNIQRAFFKRRKQAFRTFKRENKFGQKKLKSEKNFRRKELKNQRKIKRNSKTGFLILKPAKYTANRMKASAWQKAVNEDSENDFLHVADSAKRRIIEPVAQKVSKPEKLHKAQKKREKIADRNEKSNKKLNRQQNRLKEKHKVHKSQKNPKHRTKSSFSDGLQKVFKFIKNVYENEVKKFFAVIAVPILIILLVFLFIIMIFSSIVSGGGFTLGTYTAQDYDLSQAEKYYTKLAWDMNEKVRKTGTSDWKKALKEFDIDVSDYKDNPDNFIFGRSEKFNYDAVYDFDVHKLWSFLCAYYYDFDAENGDIKYWKFKDSTEDLLDEIFNAEYEFQHYYDNTSHWEEHFSYYFSGGIDGSYWLANSENMYGDCFLPRSNPGELNGFKDDSGYIHFNENLEILNAQDGYKRTGWFIQDQRYFVNDSSGQSSEPFYSWFDDTEYGRYYGDDYHARSYWGFSDDNQIYWCVSPQDTWYWNSNLNDCCLVSYYQKNYWKTDCRLYYNVKQKKTFDEVISEKLNSISHADERITYYNLLVGTDSGEMHGNHQTLKSLTGTSIHESGIINGFGYDMQKWNEKHCNIDNLHEGVDVILNSNSDIFAPFDCKISDVNSEKNYIVLRKNDVQYWYDGNGGTKRDTEVYLSNVNLISEFEKGDEIKSGQKFAVSTGSKKCDNSDNNTAYDYVHIKIKIDTDGVGWDFIDPRLVLY